jgi:hypothetical protein
MPGEPRRVSRRGVLGIVREMRSAASEPAKSAVLASVGIGAVFGLISATANPTGWLWTALRVIDGVIFVVAVLAWLGTGWRSREGSIRRSDSAK